METYILNISNKTIAKDIEEFIYKFGNSINLIKIPDALSNQNNNKSDNDNFFDIVGLWEGTDITIEKIREKAWKTI